MLRNKSILFVIFVFMKKVLVIDNYDSFVYNVIQLLREAVVPVGYDIVRNDKIDFSGLGDYGGILLSPGPGIPAEAGELLKLIEFCKYTHPILGICLGHQAIAETFGASLYNLSRPLHGHRSVQCKPLVHEGRKAAGQESVPTDTAVHLLPSISGVQEGTDAKGTFSP